MNLNPIKENEDFKFMELNKLLTNPYRRLTLGNVRNDIRVNIGVYNALFDFMEQTMIKTSDSFLQPIYQKIQ